MTSTSTLMIMSVSTSTGQTLYITDYSVLYWYLGIIIIILILSLFKK